MSTRFCCDGLEAIIKNPQCSLEYEPHIREYILTVPEYLRVKNNNATYPTFVISHCPRCGSKFPESLFDEWHDIMETEFGLSGLIGPAEAHLIPEEYKTDEWWKRRGL
jgi:hypothetical protein